MLAACVTGINGRCFFDCSGFDLEKMGCPRLGILNRRELRSTDSIMRVTVIGTGYVGTVTGACLAYVGHRVTCVDTDEAKIERLRRGESPIYEPFLEEVLGLAAARGGIDFQTEVAGPAAESDVIFIAVGTPPLPSGEADSSYLEAAARSIGAAMDGTRFRVVVNKSTVPVGR